MDNHKITVTGVEPIEYNISSGKNITVFVDGIHASKATVEDVLTVLPEDGYVIPDTFNAQIKGNFGIDPNGYRISSNVSFPSVLKITAGDNTSIGNGKSGTIFVCPEDKVAVSAVSGYLLPADYAEKAIGLGGVRYSAEKFSFSNDVALPSIYKVVFNGYGTIHATFYVLIGDECPIPITSPVRSYYHFDRWQTYTNSILCDTQINAIWIPNDYIITLGNNISCMISGKPYVGPITCNVTVEDLFSVSAFPGYKLPVGYLPSSVFVKTDGGYHVISDYFFPDIYFVQYIDDLNNLSEKYFYSNFETHKIVNPATQINPLFTFDLEGTGYDITDFIGWEYGGKLYADGTIIVESNIVLSAMWKQK